MLIDTPNYLELFLAVWNTEEKDEKLEEASAMHHLTGSWVIRVKQYKYQSYTHIRCTSWLPYRYEEAIRASYQLYIGVIKGFDSINLNCESLQTMHSISHLTLEFKQLQQDFLLCFPKDTLSSLSCWVQWPFKGKALGFFPLKTNCSNPAFYFNNCNKNKHLLLPDKVLYFAEYLMSVL